MINARRSTQSAALITVMGVSGSGKTTLGEALGRRLGVPFADADDFHGPANVAKMSAGIPLGDADRLPWLRAIGAWLAAHQGTGGVVSCSALKRAYRDLLRESAPALTFVHLHPQPDLVRRRVAGRVGHFMPASLVDSQFQALEPLGVDEPGLVLDADAPVEHLVDACLAGVTGSSLPDHPAAP